MRDAFIAIGDDRWTGIEEIAHRDPFAYANFVRGWIEGRNLPPNRAPAT